ncbi:MAG: DUF2752 domain-containing protein [Candidatus Omnitrophica bacterium]|nr:DUF2752 domain-containing protein [Candidatus Omnitrophota bacterium]
MLILKNYFWPLAVTFAIVSALFFIYSSEPAQTRFVPPCLFHELTGYNCPGCGGFRSLHALLKGDIIQAVRFNPLLISLLPFFVTVYIKYMHSAAKKQGFYLSSIRPAIVWLLVATIFSFWIFRNTPLYPDTLL